MAALQRRAAGKMRLASASRAVARGASGRASGGGCEGSCGRRTRGGRARRRRIRLRVALGGFRETPPPRASVAARAPRPEPRAARRVSRLARAARAERRERHVLSVLSRRFDRSALRSSFRLWSAASGARARATRASRSSPNGWSRAGTASPRLRRSSGGGSSARRARARRKAAAVVKKWRRRDLHAAFAEWATTVMYALAARDNAMLFAVRITRLASHKAFRTWRDAASDLKQRRAKVTAVVERWRRADTASAFEGWRVAAARQKSQTNARALVGASRTGPPRARSARGRSARTRSRASAQPRTPSWRPCSSARSPPRSAGGGSGRGDLSRRASLARRVVRRMGALRTASALARWRDAAAEAVAYRALVSGALRKMARTKLYGAWLAWASFASAQRRQVFTLPRDALRGAERERARRIRMARVVGREARARFLSQTRGARGVAHTPLRDIARLRHVARRFA